MKPSTTLRSLIAITAGIDWTWKAAEIRGFSSTFTFASSTEPPVASITSSRMGPSVLQGPHHGAQRSTTTGTCSDRSSTDCSKSASFTSSDTQTTIPGVAGSAPGSGCQ